METTGPIDRISRGKRGLLVTTAVVIIATMTAVGLYAAAGSGSNTLVITPRVTQTGLGPGAVAVSVTGVGETFSTRRRKNPQIGGEVLFQLDMGFPLEDGNLIFDLLWTNSIDVTGPLSKDDTLLRVGLFFLDSHQQRAKNGGYIGDCDELVQREFRLSGVLTYVCPDPGPIAHNFMNKSIASMTMGSTVNGNRLLYLLADIPKTPKKNETLENSGSEAVGQVQKQDFHISLIAI